MLEWVLDVIQIIIADIVLSGDNALTFLYPSENTSTSREDLRGNQVGASYVIATITYYV